MAPLTAAGPLRVGVLGWGAIGREVGRLIESGTGDSADRRIELAAVSSRFSDGATHRLAVPVEGLGGVCDVVVEAAGPDSVRDQVGGLLVAGADVVVVSIGALVDDDLRRRLVETGPGRLLLCAGAVGGIDLLNAARLYGPIDRVTLTTTKPAAALVRDWMDSAMVEKIRSGREPVECFRGSVADAVRLFPESLNVSAALGLAAGGFDLVEVVVVASPTATTNRHEINVEAAAGTYAVSVANTPSPSNPKTSHITAWSVLRTLQASTLPSGGFL